MRKSRGADHGGGPDPIRELLEAQADGEPDGGGLSAPA